MDATIVMGRTFRGFLAERHGLVQDSRFVCPAARATGQVALYLVSRGAITTSSGASVSGPSAWVLAEDELERVRPGAPTFRATGAPFVGLCLNVLAREVAGRVGLAHGPVALPAAPYAAIEALREAREHAARCAALLVVLEALVAHRVLHADTGLLSQARAVTATNRLWRVVEERIAAQDTGVGTKVFAALSGMSTRQTTREVREIVEALPLLGGFRDTLRIVRLRRAAILLSAASLRISDVARIVGYGSTDAMGRAFRDAGLPAPLAVRAALIDEDHASRDAPDTARSAESRRARA